MIERLAVASLAALLISCAPKPENAIVGKWDIVLTISSTGQYTVHTAGTEAIEFLKDGTVVSVTEEPSLGPLPRMRKIPTPGGYKYIAEPAPAQKIKITKAGDYKFIEKDRIKIQWGGFNALDGPTVANISISDNTLILTMPDGRVKKYQKVK